jgi:hypothetical protein
MRTRKPKTAEQAHAEIAKALDEINRAQNRIRKAAAFLIHDDSANSRYAVALGESRSKFTGLRDTLYAAEQQLKGASAPKA